MQYTMFSRSRADVNSHILSEHWVPFVDDSLTQSFVRIDENVLRS